MNKKSIRHQRCRSFEDKVLESKKDEKKEDVNLKKPLVACNDRNCPVHGTLSTRGAILDGIVASDKMGGTIVMQRNYYIKLKKYDRYRIVKSRIPAHNPPCIGAKVGDRVRVTECRRLSKTVSFVVTEKLK